MTYTAENMIDLLGNEASDEDAEKFAAYLIKNGWDLNEVDGQIKPSKNDEYMTEEEWAKTIQECFDE